MRQKSRCNLEVSLGEMVRGMDTQGHGENDGREFSILNVQQNDRQIHSGI